MLPARSTSPHFTFACFPSGLRTGGGIWSPFTQPGVRTPSRARSSLWTTATRILPLDALVGEIRAGLDATLRGRAKARDPAYLSEVESRLQRLN